MDEDEALPGAVLTAATADRNVLCCRTAAANAARRVLRIAGRLLLLLLIGIDCIGLIAGIARGLVAVRHRGLNVCIAGAIVALHACRRLIGTVRLAGGAVLIRILIWRRAIVATARLSVRIALGQLIQRIAALLLHRRPRRIAART